MRISINPDDPVAVFERVNGPGWELTILLDGVPMQYVQTADDTLGFVDILTYTMRADGGDGPRSLLVHRLWGKVELRWAQRT